MKRVRTHIKPEMVPEHAQKKTKSDVETDTSPHEGERIPQVYPAPYTEIIGEVNEVDLSNDEVRLVLTSSKRFSIIIPRQQIASESTLPNPDEFVSVLRTDKGYIILTHARVSRGARHKSPTSERGDTEC